MVGHGGSSAGSYLADPTSPIPSHCASIVTTCTLRVNNGCVAENQLTYSITGGNIGNAFEVAPEVGAIKVRGKLDYENGQRVSDQG